MIPFVLVTRPADDAAETAALVRAMGFDAIVSPVLRVSDTGAALPDPAFYDGIIFSSANGIRAFMRAAPVPGFMTKTVFAVGDRTARIARDAGFVTVHAGNGTMRDLARIIAAHFVNPARLLHARGRDMREDPAQLLPSWPVDGVILYRADPVAHLDPAALAALRSGRAGAVLLYSARSARAFAAALENDWPEADLQGCGALCLADSVLESAGGLRGAQIHVAATPDQAGMLRLLEGFKSHVDNSQPRTDVRF